MPINRRLQDLVDEVTRNQAERQWQETPVHWHISTTGDSSTGSITWNEMLQNPGITIPLGDPAEAYVSLAMPPDAPPPRVGTETSRRPDWDEPEYEEEHEEEEVDIYDQPEPRERPTTTRGDQHHCAHCHAEFNRSVQRASIYVDTEDGSRVREFICNSCYGQIHTFICNSCDRVMDRRTSLSRAGHERGVYSCNYCWEHDLWERCIRCGCYAPIHQHSMCVIENGGERETYCGLCYREVRTNPCPSCGRMFRRNQGFNTWQFGTGQFFRVCDHCYSEQHSYKESIFQHDFRPNWTPFRLSNEGNLVPLFGIELEFDALPAEESLKDLVIGLDRYRAEGVPFILKKDGSVPRGCELVTMPCSLLYHKRHFPWKEICLLAKKVGAHSHRPHSCGLHIHINKSAFGHTSILYEKTVNKLIKIFGVYWPQIVVFSRRELPQIERWCTKPEKRFENDHDTVFDTVARGKYQAVNLRNDNTVEIRIFRGTLNYRSLYAALEFMACLVAALQLDKDNNALTDMSWGAFIDTLLNARETTYLRHYLFVRGLIGGPKCV